MMNLDEILKGIGSQMSKASMPPWSTPDQQQQAPSPIRPQIQAPGLGSFGSYLASQGSGSGPGPVWGQSDPGSGPMWGQSPNPGPAWPQHSALGHIAAATAAPTSTHAGSVSANDAETEAYIRQAATQRGIDPNTAVRVWGGEGRSQYAGDQGSSFGPYQLHYGNVAGGGNAVGGLGDAFTKQTGLDARDPATWQAQVNFALDNVKSGGWTPWHGAAAVGVGARDGIGAVPNTNTQTPGSYAFPVQGWQGTVQNHWGEVAGGSDLFAARGTPIVAMRGGKVLESGPNPVGGNSVLVQGDDGNQYYYAHMDAAPSVQVGQAITAGTYLGPVGDTGDAKGTGTHLHIGIGPSILLGADKNGGTGGTYPAVKLLQDVHDGVR